MSNLRKQKQMLGLIYKNLKQITGSKFESL